MPMLLTSFEFIRRRYFEFFYVFHHLYIPAVVLAVKHSDNAFLFMIGPLGLYILDRFHRFTNSNLKATRVISAKIVPLQDDQVGSSSTPLRVRLFFVFRSTFDNMLMMLLHCISEDARSKSPRPVDL